MVPTYPYLKLNARITFGIAILLLVALGSSNLYAAPRVGGKVNLRTQKEKAAKKAWISGDVKEGIELLADLYADTNDITYIYNQARCYQQNTLPDLAFSRFLEYQRKGPELNSKEKATLDQYIQECQDQISAQQAVASLTSEPPKVESHPATPEVPMVETPVAVAAESSSPKKDGKRGRGLRIAGAVTTTIGLCALGAGGTFHWLREDIRKNVDRSHLLTADDSKNLDFYRKLSLVGYGVGAAVIATDATLYLLGLADSDPDIALIPSVVPGEATLSLRGMF